MRASTLIAGIAAALLVSGTAAAEDQEWKVEKTAPVSRDGIGILDAEAGPVVFGEVLLQGIPSELDPGRVPALVVVISNRLDEEAEAVITVTLEDDKGTVLAKGRRSVELDEEVSNEPFRMHDLGSQLKPQDWPKVTVVRIDAVVDL